MNTQTKNIIKTLVVWLAVLGVASMTQEVLAADIRSALEQAGKAGFGEGASVEQSGRQIGGIISGIIALVLGFTGTIAFIMFLFGGFLWLSARGNDDQVERAKKYIRNGVIGVIIIILAYAFTYFVTDVVFQAARPG